jgi:hypothetical protein
MRPNGQRRTRSRAVPGRPTLGAWAYCLTDRPRTIRSILQNGLASLADERHSQHGASPMRARLSGICLLLAGCAGSVSPAGDTTLSTGGSGGATDGSAGGCTPPAASAVSHFPAGYVMNYQVVGPCDAHRSCMECLAGPTGMSDCQWCGDANGSGWCVAKGEACPGGIALADHWNGYCPEFCDQMDGASCDACTKQPDPYNQGCSWCPETQDCFSELAAQVGLQSAGYCAKTKAGANGLSCQDVPPLCSP